MLRNFGLRLSMFSRLKNSAFSFAIVSAVLLVMPSTFVNAQETQAKTAKEKPDDSPSIIKTLPPAYDSQMLRLAEVLGSLHYLRELCGADEGQTWRNEMETLLEAEEPTSARRAQLIARFNRGFRGYLEIYRECTPPASEAANQFLALGMRLAAEIPNRYGR